MKKMLMMMITDNEKKEILEALNARSEDLTRRWWAPTTTDNEPLGWAVQEYRVVAKGGGDKYSFHPHHFLITIEFIESIGEYSLRSYLRHEEKDSLSRALAVKHFEVDNEMNWKQRLDLFFSLTLKNVEEAFDDCYIALHLLHNETY